MLVAQLRMLNGHAPSTSKLDIFRMTNEIYEYHQQLVYPFVSLYPFAEPPE